MNPSSPPFKKDDILLLAGTGFRHHVFRAKYDANEFAGQWAYGATIWGSSHHGILRYAKEEDILTLLEYHRDDLVRTKNRIDILTGLLDDLQKT